MNKDEMETHISNICFIKSLQHNPTKRNATNVLNRLYDSDYSLILSHNVDNKTKTLKMISIWLDGGNSTNDTKYYVHLIEKIKNSPYEWFNQSTLQPATAHDVISMIMSI